MVGYVWQTSVKYLLELTKLKDLSLTAPNHEHKYTSKRESVFQAGSKRVGMGGFREK